MLELLQALGDISRVIFFGLVNVVRHKEITRQKGTQESDTQTTRMRGRAFSAVFMDHQIKEPERQELW